MLLGFETSDDAAVWKMSDESAAVLTVDFFTPIVDDPYDFGRIAAANALSDVFAMGAAPHVALNLLALDCKLGGEIAAAILQGGADAVREAGAFVGGGHTIDDPEPKYGLAVFGSVHPQHILRNAGAQPGDVLYLTKPIGTGVMVSARTCGLADEEDMRPVIDSMKELNAAGSKAAIAACAHAATDVTGFGLAGHLHEMLQASDCAAVVDIDRIPVFSRVWEHVHAYCRPNRAFSIMDVAQSYVRQETFDDEAFDDCLALLCDPQTSGGMLVAIAPENSSLFEEEFSRLAKRKPFCIGEITDAKCGSISLRGEGRLPVEACLA